MPTDVSVEIATGIVDHRVPQSLPIGVGLCLGAFASVAMWTFIGLGLRAIIA